MNQSPLEEAVWTRVQELNRAWTTGKDVSRLRDFFHRDMVAIAPLVRNRLEGRDACVSGWEQFVQQAEVLSWQERNPKVQLWADGKAAVVTYEYLLRCRFGEKQVDLAGRDLMVLAQEGGKWWLVADHFSPMPSS
jgi:ketosteroid isomerase-like protein